MHQFELAMQPPPPKQEEKLKQELYIKLCEKNLDQFIDTCNFELESLYQKFYSIIQVNREGRISHWKFTDQYAD